MATLADRLDHLLGAKAAKPLREEFGIETVEQLLWHLPMRYASRAQSLPAGAPDPGAHVTVVGDVVDVTKRTARNRRTKIVTVAIMTDERKVNATFFNEKVTYNIKPGRRGMFSGTVKYFQGQWGLSHPSYLILPRTEDAVVTQVRGSGTLGGMARSAQDGGRVDMAIFDRQLLPVYPATSKIE